MEYDIKYVVLQTKYRKMHNEEQNIFPKEWYYIKEHELKKKILEECLNKKCLIIESDNYQFFKRLALK